uniref:ABC transporter ATP-binding protein n=1 Tax=candidate division WOR-3 bacterium TaxID=2052148 RepID=A0A7C4Y6N5_UNCW3
MKFENTTFKTIRRFLRFLRPYWYKGLFAFLFMLLSVCLQLPMPFLTKFLIDNVIGTKSFRLLNIIGFVLIGVLFLQAFSIFIQRYLLSTFRGKVVFDLRMALFNHTERLRVSFFHNTETGYLMSRLNDDVNSIQGLLADTIVSFIQNILTFIVGICATLYLHPKLAIISFLILPFYALSIWVFNKRIRRMSYEVRESFAKVNKDLQELLSGIMVIKAFTGERYGSLRFIRSLKEGIRKSVRFDILGTIFSITSIIISSAGPIVLIWYGCSEIMRGRLSVGGLIAFNSFLRYLFGPTQALMDINLSIQSSLVSVRRIFEILDKEVEEKDKGIELKDIKGEIEFKDVSFSYNDKPVLRNISFKVEPCEKIGIVGETGVGKSTIASLLLRFYEPLRGRIMIDGIDIREIKIGSLRGNIGYVSQDIFLFSDTIRENIRFGRRDAGDEEIEEAVRIAGLDRLIKRLPKGYDTEIGERGVRLSGGERQRIALARAILKDPKILILDEATSNLDRKTEGMILRRMKEISNDKTLIIIAHRLSTIRDVDRVIRLEKGRIVYSGKNK